MHYLVKYLIMYIITIIVTKGISMSMILLVIKDLSERKYKFKYNEFIKELFYHRKQLLIPIYNMFEELYRLNFYVFNKDLFFHNLMNEGCLENLEEKDYKEFYKNPTMKKAFYINMKQEKKDSLNIYSEEKNKYIMIINEEMNGMLSKTIHENISNKYPYTKILFYFNSGISKYYFLIQNNEIKLLDYETEKIRNINYNLLKDKKIRNGLIDVIKDIIDIYVEDKDNVIALIKDNNYLIDDDIYDLGDIENIINKYIKNDIDKNKKMRK